MMTSWRGDRRKEHEPAVRVEKPEKPAFLKDDGGWWEVLTEQLYRMGVIAASDALALALLVDSLMRYLEARDVVKREGTTIATDRGVARHPAMAVMSGAWQQVHCMAREFGLTPSARANLHAMPVEKADDKARFFAIEGRAPPKKKGKRKPG